MRSTSNEQRNNRTYQYDRSSDDDSQNFDQADESSDEPTGRATMAPQSATPFNPLNDHAQSNVSANTNLTAATYLVPFASSAPTARLRLSSPSSSSIVSGEDSQNDSIDTEDEASEASSSMPDSESDDLPADVAGKYSEQRIDIHQKNYEELVNTVATDTHLKKISLDLGGYLRADAGKVKQRLILLGRAISENKSIRHIDINGKGYDDALDDFFDFLSKNPCLESISITALDAGQVTVLTDKLAASQTLKQTLKNLSLKSISWPDSALAKSLYTFVSSSHSLRTLHFSDNAFIEANAPEGDTQNHPDFCPLLMLACVSDKLTELSLSLRTYHLTNTELAALGNSLKANKALKNLQLKFTYKTCISDGMPDVAFALNNHPALEVLQLHADDSLEMKNPDDGDHVAIVMANTLPTLDRLQSLTLDFPFGEKGANPLAQSLREIKVSALSLDFRWKKEVTSLLLKAIEGHKQLRSLELDVGPSHIIPHVNSILGNNPSINRMAIEFCDSPYESDADYQSLVSAIEKNFQITEYLDTNNIFTNENDERVGDALTRNLQLRRVPEAVQTLKKMMEIAFASSRLAPAIPWLPKEILEQIIAAMIIYAPTRQDAQTLLDIFMLDDVKPA